MYRIFAAKILFMISNCKVNHEKDCYFVNGYFSSRILHDFMQW